MQKREPKRRAPKRSTKGVTVLSVPMSETQYRALLSLHRCLLRISELTARGIRL